MEDVTPETIAREIADAADDVKARLSGSRFSELGKINQAAWLGEWVAKHGETLRAALRSSYERGRKSAIEEAAKAVCPSCAKGWPLDPNAIGAHHIPPAGEHTAYATVPCRAHAIRSLSPLPEESSK